MVETTLGCGTGDRAYEARARTGAQSAQGQGRGLRKRHAQRLRVQSQEAVPGHRPILCPYSLLDSFSQKFANYLATIEQSAFLGSTICLITLSSYHFPGTQVIKFDTVIHNTIMIILSNKY